MSNAARKPLSRAAIRAIAIRRSIAARSNPTVAANDNGKRAPRAGRPMSAALLAACVEASGFEQHAAH